MDRDVALDTYRYLRGGMPVMLVMLASALIVERATATCWQTSISAYYFTGVHAVFIGTICAIGTLLVVYRGSNDTEDVLLNLAGILAFVVAFVPTTRPVLLCGASTLPVDAVSERAVIANVWALVVALAVSRAASWWMYRRTGTGRDRSPLGTVALWVQRAVLAVGLVTLIVARTWFVANAHGIAAVTMFGAIIVTVVINAVLVHTRYRVVYQVISVLMVLTLVATVVVHFVLDDFNHIVLVVELLLIAEFGAYWVVQTVELWNSPVRDVAVGARCTPREARLRRGL
ncbi:MAG: hypothetical protein QOJ80_3431 [Mycobacterium sp.]|jgi:hypothetical protein|nr:hypothetical protein [Mycobacterium sp.]